MINGTALAFREPDAVRSIIVSLRPIMHTQSQSMHVQIRGVSLFTGCKDLAWHAHV